VRRAVPGVAGKANVVSRTAGTRRKTEGSNGTPAHGTALDKRELLDVLSPVEPERMLAVLEAWLQG